MGTQGVACIQTILVPDDRCGRHRTALWRVVAACAIGARDVPRPSGETRSWFRRRDLREAN